MSHKSRLVLMIVVLGICAMLFMTLGARGSWSFILPFRGAKLAALVLVGTAVSVSTVLFQTITQNRILTPSIMGFDALYVLILTVAVYFLGAQEFVRLPVTGVFAMNVILLIVASLILFGTLLGRVRQDLMRMILTGIIIGVLFNSLTAFIKRMIDPNEYSVVQIGSFARFNNIETDLLSLSTVLILLALIMIWRLRFRLDVLALGHDKAINLGENPKSGQIIVLILIAILVSISTALVGPVAFLGLLVVSLAHLITPTPYHGILLPSAALIASIVLVGGQMLLERVLLLSTPLIVVVDFVGGIVFLLLLIKGTKK